MSNHSGLQQQVLRLYRQFLEVARYKPGVADHVRKQFKANSTIPRTDLVRIEHLVRQGERQLRMLKSSNVNSITSMNSTVKQWAESVVSVIRMAGRLIYDQILSSFPQRNLRMVFAYGSGVFQQKGHKDMRKNMLDFIFVVDNSVDWHTENLKHNSSHYSVLKHLGPNYIAQIQEKFGARIYFNTLVPCEGRLLKYGVIGTESFLNDLFDWETLYISGRLHKPVLTLLKRNGETTLDSALLTNQQNAVHTALLLLSDTFTEEDLFLTITGLSYTGDFRMTVGEDKNKVKNIVKPSIEQFRQIYEPILEHEDHLHWNKSQGILEQSLSATSRQHHLNLLPKMLQLGLVNQYNKDGRYRDVEEVLRNYSSINSECTEVIENCVHGIVRQSSLSQSVKGIFTAGFLKSIRYSASKLRKMWNSQQKSSWVNG